MRLSCLSLTLWALICCLGPHSLLGQKPILHLKMDKENGRRLPDHAHQQADAAMVGGTHFVADRFGQDCRAIRFDGNGYLTVPHDPGLNLTAPFTLSVWIILGDDNWLQGLQWLTLVCKGETPDERDDSPAFRVQLTSGTASVNTSSTKTIGTIRQSFPVNQWFHVVAVYDGLQLIIYYDGREVNRYPLRDPLFANGEPLNIGRDIPGNIEHFVGTMDDLRLFPKALTTTQIQAIYRDDQDRNLGSACPITAPPAVVVAPKPTPKPPATPVSRPGSDPDPTPRLVDTPPWGDMVPREPEAPVSRPAPSTKPEPTPPSEPPVAPTPVTTPPVRRPDPDPIVSTDPEPVEIPPSLPPADPIDPYDFSGVADNNLVLLLDVSGSMNRADKLPLLKEAFLNLVPHMREADRVSIITYAGATKVLLDGIPATRGGRIARAIDKLESNGKTRADKGLQKALRIATKHYRKGDNNRIILATDGRFDLDQLNPIVMDMRSSDVTLSIFSFGLKSTHEQAQLDELANRGLGNHHNILPENVDEALLFEVKGKK